MQTLLVSIFLRSRTSYFVEAAQDPPAPLCPGFTYSGSLSFQHFVRFAFFYPSLSMARASRRGLSACVQRIPKLFPGILFIPCSPPSFRRCLFRRFPRPANIRSFAVLSSFSRELWTPHPPASRLCCLSFLPRLCGVQRRHPDPCPQTRPSCLSLVHYTRYSSRILDR